MTFFIGFHRIICRHAGLLKKNILFSILRKNYISSNIFKPKELSIIFYGSDDFSLVTLSLLNEKLTLSNCSSHSNEVNLKSKTIIKKLEIVVTNRNNSVGKFCQKHNLILHSFDDFQVPPNQFDLGIVSSFGRLIPSQAIQSCRYGMLNAHGSLLPRWRGASPIQHSILADDRKTGVTIMRIKPKKFDIGDIIAQKEIPILYSINAQDLKQLMMPVSSQLLWDCISNLQYYLSNAKLQSEKGVTYAPKLKEVDAEINWFQMDSYEIERRYRALMGLFDIYTYWVDGNILRLGDVVDPDLVKRYELSVLTSTFGDHQPGMIYYHKKRHLLCVASANGTWSAFRSLSFKNRKKMSALGFYNTFVRSLIEQKKFQNFNHEPVIISRRKD